MNNEKKYLPHIAIKIAKKTVPPLSNKYVTFIEKIEILIILKIVIKQKLLLALGTVISPQSLPDHIIY